MKMRKHKEALQDADAAIDADGAFAKGYLRRAAANEALENFEDAVRDYEKVDLTSTCAFQSTNPQCIASEDTSPAVYVPWLLARTCDKSYNHEAVMGL